MLQQQGCSNTCMGLHQSVKLYRDHLLLVAKQLLLCWGDTSKSLLKLNITFSQAPKGTPTRYFMFCVVLAWEFPKWAIMVYNHLLTVILRYEHSVGEQKS